MHFKHQMFQTNVYVRCPHEGKLFDYLRNWYTIFYYIRKKILLGPKN
jgi:hypothetical protein